ncbi:MAG: flagellar biosynthesis protein FlhA [Candidatus Auribacterota bacterium]
MSEKKPFSIETLTRHGDIGLAIGIVGILIALIIPLPSAILDVLLTLNITIGILILLTSTLTPRPLDFSVFPSLLLFTTLFRLSLNVATTRQILLTGYAGKVIEIFGSFVVGGNYIVGTVIFLILVVIQFTVITKGATRIAEVAARFTLDSMPGKQLSIDADLNAGLITEDEAKKKRKELAREGDFYGAMDGASKFVRGDAMAGIIITFINILGGIGIGFFQMGIPIVEALQKYTLLTIGDGLIAQIPSLIIATASGIIVTRAGDSEESLGSNMTRQIFANPRASLIAAGILFLFGMVPGFPKIPFFSIALGVGGIGYLSRSLKEVKETPVIEEVDEEEDRRNKLEQLLQVDTMEIEIGYGLIPLVDVNQGGTLLDRINVIRKQFASDYGMIIPSIRIRDNIQIQPNEYVIKVRDVKVAQGEVEPEYYLAMNPGTAMVELDGHRTTEPAFGLPAVWVDNSRRDYAESMGYTVVDDVSVLATHLTEIIRSHLSELLSRQDVSNLLDNLKETNKAVVEEVVPNQLTLGTVHRVLQNLLRESVTIKNLSVIIETLSDYGQKIKDPDILSEFVRHNLGRSIIAPLLDKSGQLNVLSLDPQLEKMLADCVQGSDRGSQIALDPSVMQVIINNIAHKVDRLNARGEQPVLICSPSIRQHIKRMCESRMPHLTVISYAEVDPKIVLRPLDVVSLNHQEADAPASLTI